MRRGNMCRDLVNTYVKIRSLRRVAGSQEFGRRHAGARDRSEPCHFHDRAHGVLRGPLYYPVAPSADVS